MATLTSTNPYTQEINATFETLTNDELNTVINHAHQAYLSWKETSFDERKELFLNMADIIDAKHTELAQLETKEMGRLYTNAKS